MNRGWHLHVPTSSHLTDANTRAHRTKVHHNGAHYTREVTTKILSATCSVHRHTATWQLTHPTRSSKYIGVVWIIIAFTGHLDLTESVGGVHVRLALPLDVVAVISPVHALDHLGLKGVAPCGTAHALQLGYRGTSTSTGHLTLN